MWLVSSGINCYADLSLSDPLTHVTALWVLFPHGGRKVRQCLPQQRHVGFHINVGYGPSFESGGVEGLKTCDAFVQF